MKLKVLYFIIYILVYISYAQYEHDFNSLKKINIQNDTLYVMDYYRGDYTIQKFDLLGDYLDQVISDNGKIFNWINLSVSKYGRFKFKDFKIWDALVDHQGNEVFAVKDRNDVYLILKLLPTNNKLDTLYTSHGELYCLYCDARDNLYFTENHSNVLKYNSKFSADTILSEPASLYNGISEILLNDKIGFITSNSTDNRIHVYDKNYTLKYSFGGDEYFERESDDHGGGLSGFDIDNDLNIYTIDGIGSRITVFKPIFEKNKITGYKFDKVLIQ